MKTRVVVVLTLLSIGSFAMAERVHIDYSLTSEHVHTKFDASIKPAVSVPSGSVLEIYTEEATGGQFELGSDEEDLAGMDFEQVHTMTGPVYVEGAEPGDVLVIELLEFEVADWGWMALLPQFGILSGEIESTAMRTFAIDQKAQTAKFAEDIVLPLRPFAGILGVAPAAGAVLDTFPPRANGGNVDNPALVAGTTAYLPVFVEGALFSIGDTHALQGFGEVSGTALEAPMRVVLRLSVRKTVRSIQELEYETDEYYATTGFAPTIDEAARKATRHMISYLMAEKGLSRDDAYQLCSLAGDLMIAEAVDIPNMLVTMHLPKQIFTSAGPPDIPTQSGSE